MVAAPGPVGLDLLQRVRRLPRDPLHTLIEDRERYGDVIAYRLGPHLVYAALHPDHVKQVLVDNVDNYKRSPFYERLEPVLGQGLLTSEGALWRAQRKAIQPAFGKGLFDSVAALAFEQGVELAERWRKKGRGQDVARATAGLTLQVAARALFGSELAERDIERIYKALGLALYEANRRFGALWIPPDWLPTPGNHRIGRARRALHGVVDRLIEQRRGEVAGRQDLLGQLLAWRDDEGHPMGDRQMRDELTTMLLAGHETTANWLAFALYLLACHPDWADRVAEECAAVEEVPDWAALRPLDVTHRALDETLRLLPPAWGLDRSAIAADRLGEIDLPAGAVVLLCMYATHRHPDFWERPDDFDPDRFTKARSEGRHPYAFFPFGGGRRRCIGAEMARVEAAAALVALLPRLALRPPRRALKLEAGVTLRPRRELKLAFGAR